ncbi:Monofunctional chorismate mutase precursor [compost metagenome]
MSKWDSGQNIEDSTRERQVIAQAVALAPRYRLSEEAAAGFFADQIEANKMVQQALLSKWHAVGQAPDVPRADLRRDIRPRLDQLQHRLLQQLAEFSPHRRDPACPGWLANAEHNRHSSPAHAQAMIRAQKLLCINGQ